MRNCGTSLLLVWMTVACDVSAYAQAAASFAAVQAYAPANRVSSEPFALPENILVQPEYRVLLENMLARSPSFRRQCLRIANEHALTVHVRHTPVRLPGGTRAITQISRQSGSRIVARVTLHPFDNAVEMIAHEFEHIVEQLDDVDLEQKARRARSGVHAVYGAGLAFETRRALLVGRRVVEEIRQSGGQGS